MRNGSGWHRCCLLMPGRGIGGMIAGWWSTDLVPDPYRLPAAGTYPVGTGTGRSSTTASPLVAGRHVRRSLVGCGPGAMGRGEELDRPRGLHRGPRATARRRARHALPAGLVPGRRGRITRICCSGRAGRPWVVPAAGFPPSFTWLPTAGAPWSPGSRFQQAQAIPGRGDPLRQGRLHVQATVDVASIRIWLRDPVT
jgi:hypothetical protein